MATKKDHLLLCLALGKDTAERTSKMPAIAPGSKQQQMIDAAKRRGTQNSPGRS